MGKLRELLGLSHLDLPYTVHCSEIWIDLNDLFTFMKKNANANDRKEVIRRANIRSEVSRYAAGLVEKDNTVLLPLRSVLRYHFQHCDDFSVCDNVVQEVTRALQDSKKEENCQTEALDEKTLLGLYKEIAPANDIDNLSETHIEIHQEETPHLQSLYQDEFDDQQWKRISLFEFQFANIEREKHKAVTPHYFAKMTAKKWSYWETIKQSIILGKDLNKINAAVCGYQKRRMLTADKIEGIHLTVANTKHLPQPLEEVIGKELETYAIHHIRQQTVVDCFEICDHSPGIHIFLGADEISSEEDFSNTALIVRSSLKQHAPVPEIVFITQNAMSKFIQDDGEVARFLLRDKFYSKKLKDDVLFIDKDNDQEDYSENTTSDHVLCTLCYGNYNEWLSRPLSVSQYDHLKEWVLFVPLPIRILFEKAFLNAESINRSDNVKHLIGSKIGRLATIYDSCLNTINRVFFGITQEMNTAELIVNYHSIASVFNITQSSGITMSLMAAERKLKSLASPERCYFNTYLKAHPVIYESVNDQSPVLHHVRLRDCHLIFLVDNLVRIRKKADPDPGVGRTSQVCTLPETVKGLPKDAQITSSWHTDECNLTETCQCKDKAKLTEVDIEQCFLDYTAAEKVQISAFNAEAIWSLKFILSNEMVYNLMEVAARRQRPFEQLDDTEEHVLPLENISLEEIEEITSDKELEELEELEASINQLDISMSMEVAARRQRPFEQLDDTEDLVLPLENISLEEITGDKELEELEDSINQLDISMSLGAFDSESPLEEDVLDDSFHNDIGNESDQDEMDSEISSSTLSTLSAFSDLSFESLNADPSESNIEEVSTTEKSYDSRSFPSEETSSFTKFQVPPLLCRHPPPAVGRDDDKRKLREIFDDLLIKSGHALKGNCIKDRILVAPDHKIATNVFELLEEPRYKAFLPEFPVLHLIKSKITNLLTAYKTAGLFHLLKFMKDDDAECDWTKLVTLSEIETAARNIKRLSLALHIALFVRFLETLESIEAENVLEDMINLNMKELDTRWGPAFSNFISQGSKVNATFCLHMEMLQHCDEIVGIQLAERTGGNQGYNLLLALVKSSLPFAFLNGASSYASFCVQLLNEHYSAGYFYQRMKETLFSTPHKHFDSNFALDAQREMDHRDVIKGFRPSSDIAAVIPRMAVIDDLNVVREARESLFSTYEQIKPVGVIKQTQLMFLGKNTTDRDIKFASRCAEMIVRRGAFETHKSLHPTNVYERKSLVLPDTILDQRTTDIGKYLIRRYICKSGIAGTSEAVCPNIEDVEGPAELKRKVRSTKSITIKREKCKAVTQKTETQLVEERRQKELKKITKLSLHNTSEMNCCQAIVKPDGSKVDTAKARGIKDALSHALCCQTEYGKAHLKYDALKEMRQTSLAKEGLIYFQTQQFPQHITSSIKVSTVEFAGIKFKAFAKTGRQYLEFVETSILKTILKNFPGVNHVVICEEKYSFTPDNLKALTRAQRQKEDKVQVFHLKSQEEMISMEMYSKSALTRTTEGKILASNFLAANIHELQLHTDITVDVDSEFILSDCLCETAELHSQNSCVQYATPIRARFNKDAGFLKATPLQYIKQRKGEAELAQADWLPILANELEDNDAVLAYVTSGDIDAVPIHLLAVALYWPRLPNGTFQNDVYVLLKKPGKLLKPDLYCVTRIIEKLEKDSDYKDIALVTALSLCIGGNDYIPKYNGISHEQWLKTIMHVDEYKTGLFIVTRDPVTNTVSNITLNEDMYTALVKKHYCPRSLNENLLTFDEVRQLSIKLPGKPMRSPQLWMPPISAIRRVACLIKSTMQYLMTVCKSDSDLPDFLNNGGIRKTADGEIVFDLGPDVQYKDESQLLKIPEEVLLERMKAAKLRKMSKRDLPVTPQKQYKTAKRKPTYSSTPRKIRDLREKQD